MKIENKNIVAVVGSGYWGKNLVRNFYELGFLNTLVDSKEEVLKEFKKIYPKLNFENNYKKALNNKNILAVALATPAETHYRMVKEALLAEKHVFVEKPMALTSIEAEELLNLAEKKNKILMVDHLLQQHSAVIKLKELIDKGVLGKVEHIYSRRMNFGKIRTEENVLWSLAPHDIALINSILKEKPQFVTAFGRKILSAELEDMAEIYLKFQSGRSAHISVSWLNPVKEQKLVVVGSKKMAVFDDTLAWNEKLKVYNHEINWLNKIPEVVRNEAQNIELIESEPLKLQCLDFLKAIETGTKPLTEAKEGLEVIKVLEAAQKSIRENKEVNLDKVAKDFFVHESSYIDENVEIGAGTKIWHFSHVLKASQIGENCSLGQNVVVGPKVKIGKNCKIQNNVSVYEGVELEDEVFCGPSMVFTNVINPRAQVVRKNEYRPTLVQKGASIGANATIVCGVTIGRYAFIAAGALVNKNVPAHGLMVGVPAKRNAWLCKCGIKLNNNLQCPTCNLKYGENSVGLVEK